MNKSSFKDYFLPISILVAAILIAGSLLWTSGNGTASDSPSLDSSTSPENVAEITADDHIRGDMDAPIKIIEFSDLECPYCQQFHSVMKQIVADYDQVAWVYRHFPLNNIHPEATPAAEASECVAELAGEEAFWTFVDEMFANQTNLSSGLYESTVNDLGIDQTAFQNCLDSDEHIQTVRDHTNNGIDSGAEGTPFSVVITPDGEYIPVGGYVDYGPLSNLIDQIISQEL